MINPRPPSLWDAPPPPLPGRAAHLACDMSRSPHPHMDTRAHTFHLRFVLSPRLVSLISWAQQHMPTGQTEAPPSSDLECCTGFMVCPVLSCPVWRAQQNHGNGHSPVRSRIEGDLRDQVGIGRKRVTVRRAWRRVGRVSTVPDGSEPNKVTSGEAGRSLDGARTVRV